MSQDVQEDNSVQSLVTFCLGMDSEYGTQAARLAKQTVTC